MKGWHCLTLLLTATVHDPIDDSTNYKFGFYHNPDDKRILVPKRLRFMGYTFNFARPESWVIVGAILAIGMAIAAYAALIFVPALL
jgi:uncharacterized membrane protein